jgi:hypothetical protein
MLTLKTKAGEEIRVSSRLVARLAERMWRRMGPEQRENYVSKACKRISTGRPARNAAAIVLAAGG